MPLARMPDRTPTRPRRTLEPRRLPVEAIAMVLVAFALRALYAWLAQGPHAVPTHDESDYDAIAWNLARGLGYRLAGASGLYPTAFRPPVLPWLTSLLYRVTGHDYFAALLLQCAFGALVPVALAGLARSTWGSGVARWAGWLAAVHPLLVFFSGYLLTETVFSLLLVLALAASVEWLKTPRPGRALGTGLLWGAAILARPNALLLPPLVAAWAWFPLGLTVNGRDRVRQLGMLALGVMLAVGPWTLRNARELHAFVPVTTGGGKALLDANNPVVWNDTGRRGGAMSVYDVEPYASQYRGLDEARADALSGRLAREFLAEHRAEWPAMAAAKLARFWRLRSEGGSLTGHWTRPGSPLSPVLAAIDPLLAWSLVVIPLALAGTWLLLASPKRLFLSLPLLVIATFTAMAVVYWGALRMRVPIEPLVVLLAAVGADALVRRWRMRRSGLALVGGGG
jgi:4-amino-4-deoxy-L-arabinose transferase-like glycosyltransferase